MNYELLLCVSLVTKLSMETSKNKKKKLGLNEQFLKKKLCIDLVLLLLFETN